MRLFLFLTGLIFAGLPLDAGACQICFPFPEKSTADLLIESDEVVLAREDPERPFHFATVEVLKGNPGADEIDLFLDSATRRLLASYPERSVVLTGKTERGKYVWRRIGMADAEFGPLAREILKLARAWKKMPRKRIAFFRKQLGHGNSQISSLAHLEIARAPYSEIKRMGGALPRDEIHAFLKNFRYVEWHALYILLLAQSGDVRDREFISGSLRSAARFSTTTRLAAWATAAIELEGAKAIEFIETNYFRNRGRGIDELREVAKALSVHGASDQRGNLRDRIVASYEVLLNLHPAMTAQIATDLMAWKRTECAGQVAKYLAAHPRQFDFRTTLRLRAYGRKAGRRESGPLK